MSMFHVVITATLLFGTVASDIPLAPYNVKLYCRMGRAELPESEITALCPTASTSCGYLEFSSPSNTKTESVYECVDSSVFVTENDDNESEKENLFKRYCDDHSRCRLLSAGLLNEQFVEYLNSKYGVKVESPDEARVKFCCAVNNVLLDKVIRSGLAVLPTVSTRHVECNSKRCEAGAIGCLIYSKDIERDYVDEVIQIQPVQIQFDDYDERSSEQSVDEQYAGPEYSNEYHCVRRHLNDELYRYCVFVEKERLPGQCFQGKGYRVCCCLFTPEQSTCDPLAHTTLTTTERIPVTAPDGTVPSETSTTAMVHIHETPPDSLAEALTPSHAPMVATTAPTHFHHTSSSLSGNSTSESTFPQVADILSPPTSISRHSIPDRDDRPTAPSDSYEKSAQVAAASTLLVLPSQAETTTSQSPSTTATVAVLRTRCRTVMEDRPRAATGRGASSSTKKVVCDSELNAASALSRGVAVATITLLCLFISPVNA